jgi:hypothetical protein
MIEINLVPDVKQEFIHAKRVRAFVISGAILVGIISVSIVVLLAIYLFGVQTVRSNLADNEITKKSQELANVSDIEDTLTIQHQLTKLGELHDEKNITSRFFDLLVAINPASPNNVSFSLARVDAEEGIIRLEGQAENGYIAADVLQKTILKTTVSYKDIDGDTQATALTEEVETSDLSYGEDATGKKVLRFTLTFEYEPAFFARSSKDAVVIGPNRQNVTDSYLRLPESLFSERASDEGEDS